MLHEPLRTMQLEPLRTDELHKLQQPQPQPPQTVVTVGKQDAAALLALLMQSFPASDWSAVVGKSEFLIQGTAADERVIRALAPLPSLTVTRGGK